MPGLLARGYGIATPEKVRSDVFDLSRRADLPMTEMIAGRSGRFGTRLSLGATPDGAREAGNSVRPSAHASLPCTLAVLL